MSHLLQFWYPNNYAWTSNEQKCLVLFTIFILKKHMLMGSLKRIGWKVKTTNFSSICIPIRTPANVSFYTFGYLTFPSFRLVSFLDLKWFIHSFTRLYLMQILKKRGKAGIGLPACVPLCTLASRVSAAAWPWPTALCRHLGPLVTSARLLPSPALFSEPCRQWCRFPVTASSLPPSPTLTSQFSATCPGLVSP